MNGKELAEWEPVQEEGQQLAGEAVGKYCRVVVAVHLQKRIITVFISIVNISVFLVHLQEQIFVTSFLIIVITTALSSSYTCKNILTTRNIYDISRRYDSRYNIIDDLVFDITSMPVSQW